MSTQAEFLYKTISIIISDIFESIFCFELFIHLNIK